VSGGSPGERLGERVGAVSGAGAALIEALTQEHGGI
jgi:hypothetical protein